MILTKGEHQSGMRRGFTLLELLTAVTILLMIVMMMSGVFHQVRVAWGTGMRKTKLNMEGRAAVDFMVRELSQAVADEKLACGINDGGSQITFCMLRDPTSTNRAVQKVGYKLNGSKIDRTLQIVEIGSYPKWGPAGSATLAKDVKSLKFNTSDAGNHTTNLPAWVDVEVQLRITEQINRMRAGSSGPDRVFGGAPSDDIWSDE